MACDMQKLLPISLAYFLAISKVYFPHDISNSCCTGKKVCIQIPIWNRETELLLNGNGEPDFDL
jgi:hypothetical protein